MKNILLLLIALIGTTPLFAQTDADLEKIADQLRNDATGSEFIQTLKPTEEDIKAIFNSEEGVKRVSEYVDKMFSSITKGAIDIETRRSETIVLKINSTYLKAGAPHKLPGGYNWIKDEFNELINIYGLKFVEPGKTSGYSLNAFFYVNDHWVCIPKPYRAFPRE